MSRSPAWPKLLTVAEEQWGLLTTAQAEATGMAWSTVARMVRAGTLERVTHGVYRVRGAGEPDHLHLRAAWIQLDPGIPVWERGPRDGVVSHRSAAAVYELGHLPADLHEFTLPDRKQTRRRDVRLHRADVSGSDWGWLHGLPVTRPRRIAADLLADRDDPEAVGQVIADALRSAHDDPGSIAEAIGPRATGLGLRRGDGLGLFRWLLDLSGDPERETWMREAAMGVIPPQGVDPATAAG